MVAAASCQGEGGGGGVFVVVLGVDVGVLRGEVGDEEVGRGVARVSICAGGDDDTECVRDDGGLRGVDGDERGGFAARGGGVGGEVGGGKRGWVLLFQQIVESEEGDEEGGNKAAHARAGAIGNHLVEEVGGLGQ